MAWGGVKRKVAKDDAFVFYLQEWLWGGRSIVRFQWCISTCLEKAFAPAQGLLIKVILCAFVPAVPVQEGYLTFESPYPKHKRTWLARAGWEGGMATHAVEWQLGVHGMGMPAGVCPQAELQLWRMSSPFPCSVAAFSAERPALISSHWGVVFLVVCFQCLPPPSWQGLQRCKCLTAWFVGIKAVQEA